jgi:hypothetical protein
LAALFEQLRQPLAEQGVVIDQNDAGEAHARCPDGSAAGWL